MTLDQLIEGQTAVVTDLHLVGAIRRRLQDLGLIKGTRISCVLKSNHGDPVAYRIRGALIALRNSDTKNICITKE